jgi:hypothetical protein
MAPCRARARARLKNAISFDPAKRESDPIAGNHVILRQGEVYALFAHLAPGTVAVGKGRMYAPAT